MVFKEINTINKKLLYLVIIILAGLPIVISGNVLVQVVLFYAVFVCGLFLYRFDITHPFIWLLGAFCLYSTGYPILYLLGANTTRALSSIPLIWCWVAYFSFVLFFIDRKPGTFKMFKFSSNVVLALKTIYFLSIIYFVADIYLIFRSGFSTKLDIYANANRMITFAFSWIYVFFVVYLFLMIDCIRRKDKKIWLYVAISGLISLFLTMFSGERDILFEFLIVTLIFLMRFKKINKLQVLIALIILVFVLPLTSYLKYFFLSGEFRGQMPDRNLKGIIVSLFTGEFESASRNLQILANDPSSYALFGGKTLISDVLRAFGYAPLSSIQWFNNAYYSNSNNIGYGFTLVGEGIINFGIVGVFVVFALFSLLLSVIYKYKNNAFGIVIYICSVSIFMYSLRADFANVLSPLLRHAALPVFVLYIMCFKKGNQYVFEKNV